MTGESPIASGLVPSEMRIVVVLSLRMCTRCTWTVAMVSERERNRAAARLLVSIGSECSFHVFMLFLYFRKLRVFQRLS
jgi:hypothetical protein